MTMAIQSTLFRHLFHCVRLSLIDCQKTLGITETIYKVENRHKEITECRTQMIKKDTGT